MSGRAVPVKKRVFVGLLGLGVGLIGAVGAVLWYVVFERPDFLSGTLISLVFVGFLLVVPVLGVGVIAIVVSVAGDRSLPVLGRLIRATIDFLFPLALLLGRLMRIDKEKIEGSFVELNNSLVRSRTDRVRSDRLLVLLPHCLQRAECRHKITVNLNNCRRCGRCSIGDLAGLEEDYGVRLSVASGGTQARRVIQRVRPTAIIAVACERELASGIHDVSSIPVLGIPNARPSGPCYNTQVDPSSVRRTIELFLGATGEREGGPAACPVPKTRERPPARAR